MLRTSARTADGTRSHYAKRIVFALAALMILAVTFTTPPSVPTAKAAEGCVRETIWVGSRLYGGREYNDFVSCGSSAGNFAYTCAEGGGCYENPTIDANDYCHCDYE